MNHVYSLVWSRVLGCMVVASELAKSGGKGARSKRALAAAAVAVVGLQVPLLGAVEYEPLEVVDTPLHLLEDTVLHVEEGNFFARDAMESWRWNQEIGEWELYTTPAVPADAPEQAGVISGDHAIIKTGLGQLELSNGSNSYTGGTVISSGALAVTAAGALGTGPVTNDGALYFVGNDVSAGALDVESTGHVLFDENATAGNADIVNAGGSLMFRNEATAGDSHILNTSVLDADGDTRYGFIQFQAGQDSSGILVNSPRISTAGNATIINEKGAQISFSSGGYTMGTAHLLNRAGSDAVFNVEGDASGGTVVNEARGSFRLTQQIIFHDDGTQDVALGTLSVGSLSGAGNVILGGNTLTVGALGGDDHIAGDITDSGSYWSSGYEYWHAPNTDYHPDAAGALVKVGDGTLTLSGDNTFLGGISVQGGALEVSGNNSLGGAGGGLTLDGGAFRFGTGFIVDRNVVLGANGGTIDTAGHNASWVRDISGTGGLAKTGEGLLVLSGNNSYAGGTRIEGGILEVATDQQLGAPTGGLVFDGGTLRFAGGFATGRSVLVEPGGATFDTNTHAITLDGLIEGTGSVTKAGDGTLSLGRDNSYAGGTVIARGALEVLATGALGSGPVSNAGALYFIGEDVSAGALEITNSDYGWTVFDDHATAGEARIVNEGGGLYFRNAATAGNSHILNTSVMDADGNTRYGYTQFQAGLVGSRFVTDGSLISSAGNATIINEKGATVSFASGGYSMGSATLTNRADSTVFFNVIGDASGGTVVNEAGGAILLTTQISYDDDGFVQRSLGNLSIGSLSGAGSVLLAGNTLTVGALGQHDKFSGTIADSGTYLDYGQEFTHGPNQFLHPDAAGSLVKVGDGTLTLSGDNTYAGGTTVLAGAVEVFEDGNLGDAAGVLTLDGGALKFGAGFTSDRAVVLGADGGTFDTAGHQASWTGVISGEGALNKAGAGRLILSGDNTFSGGTTVAGGILRLEHDNALGTGGLLITGAGASVEYQDGFVSDVDVVLDADVAHEVGQDEVVEYGGTLSGSGGVALEGPGTLVLSGDNTYTGGTHIQEGTVEVSADNNLGAAEGELAFSGGTLRFADGFDSERSIVAGSGGATFDTNGHDASLGGVIAGEGGLTKTGAGSLALTGDNHYSGGTAILGGTVRVDSDASLGGAEGGISIDGGTLQLAGDMDSGRKVTLAGAGTVDTGGNNARFNGAIEGEGGLTKTGDGVLELSGANSYLGGTSVQAGTLVGNTGSVRGDLENHGTVKFAQSDSGGYEGVISGAGTLEKTGGGQLLLTGDSSGFEGSTQVHEGSLRVNGALGGTLSVGADGVLDGTGTVGSLDVEGAIAPGNSIGTLTVDGDYVQAAGSEYQVEIAPGGHSDRIAVTGTAVLEGGTVAVTRELGRYRAGDEFTILTAGEGVTGQFEGISQHQRPFLALALDYGSNDVQLQVTRNLIRFQDYCTTFNECSVATALDRIEDGALGGDDMAAVMVELGSVTEAEFAPAMQTLNGQSHASFASIMLEGSAATDRALRDRQHARRTSDNSAGGGWVEVHGRSASLDGGRDVRGADIDTTGVTIGADGWLESGWLLGASLGTSKVDADMDIGDRAEADGYALALYGSFNGERVWVDSSISYGKWDNELRRVIRVADLVRHAESDYGGNRLSVELDVGLDYALGNGHRLQPFVGLRHDKVEHDGFRETGAGDVGLVGKGHDVEQFTTSLGLDWSREVAGSSWTVRPHAGLEWLHTTGSRHAGLDLAFAGAPEAGFHVRGVELPSNRAVINVGVDGTRGDGFGWFAAASYESGSGYDAGAVHAGLRWAW